MTAIVNSLTPTPSHIELSFTWAPVGFYTVTMPNGQMTTTLCATVNSSLTFTAATMIGSQGNDLTGPLTILEYRWDFGDGVTSYGNPTTHTYKLINFNAQTVLRVTDSKGRHWFTRSQMYLQPSSPPRSMPRTGWFGSSYFGEPPFGG